MSLRGWLLEMRCMNWEPGRSSKEIMLILKFQRDKTNIMDTSLLALNTSFLNSMSFNRYSSKWGLDISNVQNSGKALLTYGYESRQQKDWTAKLRINLSRTFTFDVNNRKGFTG